MSQAYRGLEAEWHDLFWEDEDAPSEFPLIEEFLKDVEGESLYVGSGSGRLLGPLVEKGHTVTGLEVSPEMVALSRERWPQAQVIEGDWKDAEGEWAAILLPGFTFQLFTSPSAQLKKMAHLVGEGGRAYVSLFFPWSELSGEFPQGHWYHDRDLQLPDGRQGEMRTRHFLDDQASVLKREHRYLLKSPEGEVIREDQTKQTIRIFADGELEKLLARSGWRVVKEIHNFGEEEDLVYVITLFLEVASHSSIKEKVART